jgi:hypothetical protein
MNAGPNATTFALAPELFPTGIRASASGFAAATANNSGHFAKSNTAALPGKLENQSLCDGPSHFDARECP